MSGEFESKIQQVGEFPDKAQKVASHRKHRYNFKLATQAYNQLSTKESIEDEGELLLVK